MPDFINGSKLKQRLRAALSVGHDADFAVAFWGEGAAVELGIKSDREVKVDRKVRIVCNLLTGGTNPKEIRTLLECGAEVRQLNDLHAKIGVVGGMSFMGSSNMSKNGLGAVGNDANWQEANVVYRKARPEIQQMFEKFWDTATSIEEADLQAAGVAWARRQKANRQIAGRQEDRSLIDVLRKEPALLDALNVRMVVYDAVTDEEELTIVNDGNERARELYGQAFEAYWHWESIEKQAQTAYLLDYYRSPRSGELQGGTLYRRNTFEFPDFTLNRRKFQVVYKIKNIAEITYGPEDKKEVRKAFLQYVSNGERGEQGNKRFYNFPISELARYL
ncbi:MAG: phospholipase D family protein [Rhizobiaceae bacterium]|nr:phospholipase D family protein [Rhizobiaceae bacterium]